jgi:hypothetical protein
MKTSRINSEQTDLEPTETPPRAVVSFYSQSREAATPARLLNRAVHATPIGAVHQGAA